MLMAQRLSPALGAILEAPSFDEAAMPALAEAAYEALMEHQVIFFQGTDISPAAHLAFAQAFGEIDEPHPIYPSVDGFDRIVKLENNSDVPPDTNSWHTDLTYKRVQPFASILVARSIPELGGDTLWSSLYAAYDRLPEGMKSDLAGLEAIHDLGDFRNTFSDGSTNTPSEDRLNDAVPRFGHQVRPLVDHHPVTGRPFLNFNEAFVTHISGLTTNESNILRVWLANHMNRPEVQIRWRWQAGDIAMWDNRITMHYAVADYYPAYRCMNRVTVVHDRRVPN